MAASINQRMRTLLSRWGDFYGRRHRLEFSGKWPPKRNRLEEGGSDFSFPRSLRHQYPQNEERGHRQSTQPSIAPCDKCRKSTFHFQIDPISQALEKSGALVSLGIGFLRRLKL